MQELFKHIAKFTTINQDEFQEIASYFEKRVINKKEMIYTAGESLHHYFIVSGCVHMYFVNDFGKEQTIHFAINDWWITDYSAFQKNGRSDFFIKAVDTTELFQISFENQEKLIEKFPKIETYFRKIYQIGYGAATMRLKYIFSYSKEEIYFKFRDAFPDFVNNVPQYLVATYLGLSPEYVSKLRRKDVS